MHGLIMASLENFVIEEAGLDAWTEISARATLSDPYMATAAYPDEEAVAIISHASDLTGLAGDTIQKSFGEYVVRDLLETYGTDVDADWDYFDFLEHTEAHIHDVVRRANLDARPPALDVQRVAADAVEIEDTSDLQLCPVLEGIAKGFADHYDEQIDVTHERCMHDEDEACLVRIARA
jgi:hypothetical protein